MHSKRLAGVALIAATWIGYSSTAQADVTVWSTNAAACVPVSAAGLVVTAGAVTAGSGNTVTLYCGVTKHPGGFAYIEITYKGGGPLVITGEALSTQQAQLVNPLFSGVATSQLIEMSRQTGVETVKCGVQSKGSVQIATERNICNNSNLDFEKNFYYLRINLRSGLLAGQDFTVYGSSLVSR